VKIPGAARAVLDPAKIRRYLLSREHVVGSAKARFFAQLGFDTQNWTVLRDELYGFASQEAQPAASTRFGQKIRGARYDNWAHRALRTRTGRVDYLEW
jgi:hypothetical protein